MKKIISLIIGILAFIGISSITIYTLTNRGIRTEITNNKKEIIELINSNYNDNILAELYNVYLNGQRHKIKLEYKVNMEKEMNEGNLELIVYVDGGNIIDERVISNLVLDDDEAEKLFENEEISQIKLEMEDIQIVKIDNLDYILLEIDCYGKYAKSYYFLFNDSGDLLVPNGAVIKDESVHYISSDNIFYGTEEQIMAKFEDGALYVLEPIITDEEVFLIECKYYYKDNEATREELRTYEGIKISS